MQPTLLTCEERAVIAALGDGGEGTLPSDLDSAVHSLEERGWISLISRGAVIDGEREYTLGLTPHGRIVRDDLTRPRRGRQRSPALAGAAV